MTKRTNFVTKTGTNPFIDAKQPVMRGFYGSFDNPIIGLLVDVVIYAPFA